MYRRAMLWVAVSLLAAFGSAPAAGQRLPSARLAAARTALQSMHLDSAALVLRRLLRSADEVPREDRVEAWLLLGVVEFYQGRDSGTAADFREALILEPAIRADGLAPYDSVLVTLLEAQRSGRRRRGTAARAAPAEWYDRGLCHFRRSKACRLTSSTSSIT